MKHFISITLFLLASHRISVHADIPSHTPPEILHGLLSSTDSVAASVLKYASKAEYFHGRMDSLLKSVTINYPLVYGLCILDENGRIITDYNRMQKTVAITNVSLKNWFTVPLSQKVPFFGGIVRANSKYYFLKSYPASLNFNKKPSTGVLVILIDAAQILEQLAQKYNYPFTVFYNSVNLFSSSSYGMDLPSHGTLSGYEGLTISFDTAPATQKPLTDAVSSRIGTNTFSILPSSTAYAVISLVFGVITFIIGRYYRKKFDYKKFLEIEYEKISKEQHQQIHDRALSQVYCEIKRQIETHELKNIEDEIRHKIEREVEDKIYAN